ncbi:branched-chain amino acid transport system II carrier protein [Lacticaseibacillus parakribbianus]|uniref:branched-chain amino acid transport system II carrier protein n=1 Tax=Lacticaseibacillus parakribbianus TaxID=2970927 RepID=UPI0021CB92DA|nr:branched-chain amino acid transport system II carrier protein [Lacticaseibacillus parakribbianus]
MSSAKPTPRQLWVIGAMLFGLFFGAGNLIFPVFVGQQAGANLPWAMVGFLASGVGLPLLGVAAIGMTGSAGVFELAAKVGRPYAYVFTIALYLCIGPAFALPRLASISYEVGLVRFVAPGSTHWALAAYSVLFFGTAWWFARRPSQIMTYVGKFLTPAFLVTLGVLLAAAVFRPLGGGGAAVAGYQGQPLTTGFTDGYATMDALAALAFGIIVVDAIRGLGVTAPKAVAGATIRAGVLAATLMGVVYVLLALLGKNALGRFGRATNGGPILANVAHAYFGDFGNVLLAIIVVLACLKTAIGLITAFGDTFKALFPRLPYPLLIGVATVVPLVFANVGLDRLLAVSTPALMALYPLAIVLIALALASPWLGESRWLFGTVTLATAGPALLDGLNALPAAWQGGWVGQLLALAAHLPGSAVGLGWCVPAAIGLVVGLGLARHCDA